jgi:glucosamine--fructose-6-phosphate aminotransferase (isomerizing)
MCGIVAIATATADRTGPDLARVVEAIDAATRRLTDEQLGARCLTDIAAELTAIDRHLRGPAAVGAIVGDALAAATLRFAGSALFAAVDALDARVEAAAEVGELHPDEALNTAVGAVKDAAWAILRDRLRTADAVEALSNGEHGAAAIEAFYAIQLALSALDRLEVRGRDSAGIHVLVRDHGVDLADPTLRRLIAQRSADPLFGSGSVRVVDGCFSFVYKRAAEVGELGDNTTALRAAIRSDDLLRLVLHADTAHALVVSHTRWASIGIISEPNCHPLNSEECSGERDEDLLAAAPYVIAALNGDVDNYADLSALDDLRIPTEITTDAKIIPTLVSRRIASGLEPVEAFRSTVASFEGSVAIAASLAIAPDCILLAQRGSGQALYVGLADGLTIVASEPYGVVEVADRYMRLDGETAREPGNPATQGQVVAIDGRRAGQVGGVRRIGYEGSELPIRDDEFRTPEVTTRDIDRGDSPHFLLKEIGEAPGSLAKTLRGRLAVYEGRLRAELPLGAMPRAVRDRLRTGATRRVFVIGQGTAAVAGQSLAVTLRRLIPASRLAVEAVPATELSGFGLGEPMDDTLVIAISQSGTTTDTNRTVDVVRGRGASVIAIVNRRGSDLVDKSDGVLYTSDGRDVEMSVASTKAFYAQVAAGFLVAYTIAAEVLGASHDLDEQHEVLRALRELPSLMTELLGRRSAIAAAALRHAPARRYWALVGNGPNRTAAHEVRIKLSELCYKSIACDLTEDKKHIDLSAEPLILVCAAGLSGSNADDVGKEVAIYRAHKAAPIVICNDGETRMSAALETLSVPPTHPQVAFVLSAMAGHLFGYEAALAIDASAVALREARGAVESVVAAHPDADDLLLQLERALTPLARRYFETLRAGGYDGTLGASAGVRLAALFRYATGVVPLDLYEVELGKVGTPSTLVEDLTAALTTAIEELTRPIDAIKHQAKTVTVGISRSDETLLGVRLVREVLATGCARDHLSYRSLRTLVELDAAVVDVTGFTRYRIDGDVDGDAAINVVDRGGVGASIASRTERDPRLRGTKHRAAWEREVTVFRGRADGRTGIIVPEVKDNEPIGLTLVHVRFHDRLAADVMARILRGYRGRYSAIQDQVTEVEPTFREDVLAAVDVVDLLTQPVVQLAEHWRE